MGQRLLFGFGLGAILFAGSGSAQAQAFTVGDAVECSGMQGTIIRTEPRPGWDEPFFVVRVQGAATVYEIRCLPRTMRRAAGAASAPSGRAGGQTQAPGRPTARQPAVAADAAGGGAGLCRPGARLEGQWGIQWYAVTVQGPPNANGQCPVSFDGYGRSWDNFITVAQLRPRGSGPITRPVRPVPDTAQASQAVAGAPPDGTYRCHKISPGGQLMHIGILDVRGARATLRGMPAGWTVRSVFVRGTNDRGQMVVAFDYRSAAGFNDRLDCLPQ